MFKIEGKYTSAKIFSETKEDGVIEQTTEICNHPIFKDCKIRVMPDCHRGKGCTIGFTAELPKNREIIPNIIGVDQNCGMYVVKLKKAKTLNDYAKLDKVIREHIPYGRNGREKVSTLVPEDLLEDVKRTSKDILKQTPNNHLKKIGSLGGGNHFISIEKGSTGTYLIVHSGSRNFGKELAIHFQKIAIEKNCYESGQLKELSYLTDKDSQDYLNCAKICAKYAHYNRKIIVSEILTNMGWKSEEDFETVHNYIGDDEIIRKGAISCKKDEKVLIPLNMADGSLIAVGLGNEDWNNSAPHGAGRMYSRSQAKDLLTMKEYKERMKNIYSSCISFETLDESPMAYKAASIIKDSIRPTAKLIDHLIPVYNFKASE